VSQENAEFTTRFPEIKTMEQAQNYLLEVVKQVEKARDQCNVHFPGDNAATARYQKTAYRNLMIRYGQALGALVAFAHARILNDVAYNEMNLRIQKTMTPTIVGVSHA